jgi:hypothetical protein
MAPKDKDLVVTVDSKKLERLSDLLQKSLEIYEQDRCRAIDNYNLLRAQLEKVYGDPDDSDDNIGAHMSEDALLERAVNDALKIVIKASDKLDKVITTVREVVITQLNNENRSRIAKTIGGSFIPRKPVDFAELRGKRELEYNNDEDED